MKYLNKLSLRNAPRGALLLEEAKGANPWAMFGAGTGVSFGQSVLSQMFGRSNMAKQNEYVRQNMLLSNELNRRNVLDQGLIHRQAVQGAGLSINADKAPYQIAASSPLAPSGQSNPQMFDASVISALSNAFQTKSNIELNKGLENKANAEAEEIRSRIPGNTANSKMLQMRLDRYNEILGLEVSQAEKNVQLTDEQIQTQQKQRDVMEQQIKNMLEEIEKVRAETAKIGEEAAYIRMRKVWEQKEMQAHIAELYALAQYHKDAGQAAKDQAKAALDHAAAAIKDAGTRAMVAPSEQARNEAEAELAKIQKALTDKYGDAEKVSGLIGNIIGTAATIFIAGGAAKFALKGGASLYKGTKIGFTAP